MKRIGILGASHSGKSWLAAQLRRVRPDLKVMDNPPISNWPMDPTADLFLLMGMDLPGCVSQEDAGLRSSLAAQGLTYAVVYGQGQERLRNALRLIESEPTQTPRWTRFCESCSDPECEHLLFTGLSRSMAAGPLQA